MSGGTDVDARLTTKYANSGLDGNGGVHHDLAMIILRFAKYPALQEDCSWLAAQASSVIAQTTVGKLMDALYLDQPDESDIPSIHGRAGAATWSENPSQYDLSSAAKAAIWEEQTLAFICEQAPRMLRAAALLFGPGPAGATGGTGNQDLTAAALSLSFVANVLHAEHTMRRQPTSAYNPEVATGVYMDPHMLAKALDRPDLTVTVRCARVRACPVARAAARSPQPAARRGAAARPVRGYFFTPCSQLCSVAGSGLKPSYSGL